MIGREDKKSNDLFFICSLIEYIARKTKNRRAAIIDCLGKSKIQHLYDLADVYHSENMESVSNMLIEQANIPQGNYDNICHALYSVPSHWDIGKVYKRLILGISKEKQKPIIDALFVAYHSFVSDKIDDYNSSFYYEAPQNILNAFLYNTIE